MSSGQMLPSLDALFKTRFHGAINIRGIRYQLLYAFLRTLDLYDTPETVSTIQLEGIEDLDVIGPSTPDVFVQVKTAQSSWSWGKLSEPLVGFLLVLRRHSTCRFLLAVDFPLTGDMEKLSRYATLEASEQRAVTQRFITLCLNLHTATKKITLQERCTIHEAKELLARLDLVSLPEAALLLQLRQRLTTIFALGSDAVDVYLLILVGRFLEWAKDRMPVTRALLNEVRVETGAKLARESVFEASGRGLIEHIAWTDDAHPADFFDSKGTRAGHIVSALDVVRSSWLEQIDQAIHATGICMIRAPSGQGKSTLLYRYAHDYWQAESVVLVRIAETAEQVEQIHHHLQFRASLGLPLLILVDGAGWQTRLWPRIAQACAGLGLRMLVTVRNEDWQRFGQEGLTSYLVIEPTLDLAEARRIFTAFQAQQRIDTTVISPEWAFEQLGETALLMEYVYLITHGRMLAERLSDQVRAFAHQGEDPAKRELLRRVALADTCGVPVALASLVTTLPLTTDPQIVVDSLVDEYLHVDKGMVRGLHRLRSEHLVRLLHSTYPTVTQTAIATFGAIPHEAVVAFVSGVLARVDVDQTAFLTGLVASTTESDTAFVLTLLEGLFAGGEQRYCQTIAPFFDDVHQFMGTDGEMLLGTALLPITPTDLVTQMAAQHPTNANLQRLPSLASIVQHQQQLRGLDLCRLYLQQMQPLILLAETTTLQRIGILLDWYGLCGLRPHGWHEQRALVMDRLTKLDMSLKEFCACSQGLYRCDIDAWRQWFDHHQEAIIGYLQWQTAAIELHVDEERLAAGFLFDPDTEIDPHAEVMRRLRLLHSAVPCCEYYQSQVVWLLPFGLTPTVDDTRKNIPISNLLLNSDIEKNSIWTRAVALRHVSDGFYLYQKAWYDLRTEALAFAQALSTSVQSALEGHGLTAYETIEQSGIRVRLHEALNAVPEPPLQMAEEEQQRFKEMGKRWMAHLTNVFHQFIQYYANSELTNLPRLIVTNGKEVLEKLPALHEMFDILFTHVPDYFAMTTLNERERKGYLATVERLDLWLLNRPTQPLRDVQQAIIRMHAERQQGIIASVAHALSPLMSAGPMVVLPTAAYEEHLLWYVTLGFTVANPAFPERELEPLLATLVALEGIVSMFYLVPLYEGSPFLVGGYRFAHYQLQQMVQGMAPPWETFVPQPVPEQALSVLPVPPRHGIPRLDLRDQVIATIGKAANYGQLWERLVTIRDDNRFTHMLAEREQRRVSEKMLILAPVAQGLQAQMREEFSEPGDQEAVGIVTRALALIAATAHPGTVPTEEFAIDDVIRAFTILLS